MQATAFLVQSVRRLRLLLFDSAVYSEPEPTVPPCSHRASLAVHVQARPRVSPLPAALSPSLSPSH
eukprot:1284530-Rhodomonas_salina.2